MLWWLLGGVGYVVCGIFAYGITLAYFQTEYPQIRKREDAGLAAAFGLLGPIALLVGFLTSDFARHGLQWKPQPQKPCPWEQTAR